MTDSTTLAKPPNAISVTGFFADEGFDFLTRCAIGYAAQGVMDVGQVFATIARITDGDADSWYAAWRQTAGHLHAKATAALIRGHDATRTGSSWPPPRPTPRPARWPTGKRTRPCPGPRSTCRSSAGRPMGRAEAECRIFDFLHDHLASTR